MNKLSVFALLVAVVALASAWRPQMTFLQETAKQESPYARIMRTGTLRCGYALYDPLIVKDPKTGALRGVFFDLVNEMGRELDLKIDWTAEVGYGEIEEGFLANKYDVFCSGAVVTPKRAKFVGYTIPLYYQTTVTWVRANDHRFDESIDRLNAPDVTLVVRDGDVPEMIARKSFPKAKTLLSPQMVDYTQMLVDVQTGKADAAFFEKSFGDKFLASNPGTLKIAMPHKPVNVSPVSMMLPLGAWDLKNVLDVTLTKMILNGSVEAAFRQSAPDYDLWAVAPPYVHLENKKPN